MIKHVFCCLLLNFICLNVNAQITDWSWIRLVSGVKGITTIELKLDADVAVDSKNNIISIGAFTGTLTFG
jgi:hypothetical protein